MELATPRAVCLGAICRAHGRWLTKRPPPCPQELITTLYIGFLGLIFSSSPCTWPRRMLSLSRARLSSALRGCPVVGSGKLAPSVP